LFWYHEYDPDIVDNDIVQSRQLMIEAGKRRGLNTEDILLEEANVYGSICARERQYLLIATHIDSLPKTDQGVAIAERQRNIIAAAKGDDAMMLKAGIDALEALHEQQVNKVTSFMQEVKQKYAIERLNCGDALRAMRVSLIPSATSPTWKPLISLKDIRFRATNGVKQSKKDAQSAVGRPNDWTFRLPPKLSNQLMEDAVDFGRYALMADRVYAPMYVSELAQNPVPLEKLLVMCYKRRLPVRLAFSLMANSEQSNYWNRLFASVFSFASTSNRQISKADSALRAYVEAGGAVLGFGIAASTWAKAKVVYSQDGTPSYDVSELQERARDVETQLQQWGGQQVDTMFGCAIEATMSATTGYTMPPICPKAPSPERDVVTQLPIMRPASLWEPDLSMWFRTPDGVLMPHQPMSKKQNAMLTLISGGMGYGKSNSIADHIFFFANHPLAREMAYIRGIDFGQSSVGVVDLIIDSLPPERKHEAIFKTFVNDGSMIKNVFDTRLSLRYPLSDHSQYLMSLFSIICDSLLAEAGVLNVMNILKTLIEEAYQEKDPRVRQSSPNRYEPHGAEPQVIEALARIEYEPPYDAYWWEVADALADFGIRNNDPGITFAAQIAQRHAVPQIGDLLLILDRLSDRFKNTLLKDGTALTNAIAACIASAINIFPCMTGRTNIDISEARVCVFDMSDAFGRGTTTFDDWRRSMFFAVVMRLQTEDLFVNLKDTGKEIEEGKERFGLNDLAVQHHLAYLESQAQIDKLFWADEVHRIGQVDGALSIIDSMALEGRKYNVGILLGTQIPKHFPPKILELASTFFVFGSSQSMSMANDVQEILTLTDDERDAIFQITKPTASKGAMVFAVFKTAVGVQRLLLHFQMGGIKRWAYATEADERALRGILYRKGPSPDWARRTLAKNIPDIQVAIKAKMDAEGGSMSRQDAIEQIANDMLRRI
jgi:hypothetical protein